jgi:hypothetical protein
MRDGCPLLPLLTKASGGEVDSAEDLNFYVEFSSVPTFFRGERADLTRNPTRDFSMVA